MRISFIDMAERRYCTPMALFLLKCRHRACHFSWRTILDLPTTGSLILFFYIPDSADILSGQMKFPFKTFLIWLLIAVLPLHATATIMGMSCGPVHQKAMQTAFVDHAHHEDVAIHDHHHNDAYEANPLSRDSSMTADASAGTSHQHSPYGNCTASCVGAAGPPSAFHSAPALHGAEIVVISSVPLATGIIPDGLERPPRSTSA